MEVEMNWCPLFCRKAGGLGVWDRELRRRVAAWLWLLRKVTL